MPNVLLCIPLDHTREAERGVLMSGQPSSSIQLPRLAPWKGYSSAAASATDQRGRQQLRVISPEHIGVSLDATGCFRRWEGPSRPTGQLRKEYVCKRDLRAGDIAPTDLEALAADRNVWRLTTKSAAVKIEQKLKEQHEMRRQRRRVRAASDTLDDKAFVCPTCKKTCRSRIGLYSHSRRCSSTTE